MAQLDAPEPWPDPDDVIGWESRIRDVNAAHVAPIRAQLPPESALKRRRRVIGGVPTYELRPSQLSDSCRALFLELHGGGLVLGGGDLSWEAVAVDAVERAGVTWAPDYRMPPAHPYPAALDDAVAVYKSALEIRDASEVIVSGVSAGGNLAAALMLRAIDEGLPVPAGLVLRSPELDLTESGDTFRTLNGIDVLESLMPLNLLYAGENDLSHPYLSPLFGDVEQFPPTFVQSGTRDLFLSNAVRMHRRLLRAGVRVELHVFEAMPHVNFGGAAPEDAELRAETRRFERECLGAEVRP